MALTKAEAKKRFAEVISVPCPTHDKPVGELCDTPTVWVCLDRMKASPWGERNKLK